MQKKKENKWVGKQKEHYLEIIKCINDAHEQLIQAHLKGISISDRHASEKPFDLEFWRNRANAFEDAYRHIWEFYNISRLRFEQKPITPESEAEEKL